MKIMRLQREDIPLVTKGANPMLVDNITAELDMAERQGCVLYVRYGPMFLQYLRVDRMLLATNSDVKKMLLDEEMWEHQRPNSM